jgi:hypothetical protein
MSGDINQMQHVAPATTHSRALKIVRARPFIREIKPQRAECLGADLDPFLNSLLNPTHLRAMPSTQAAVDMNLTTGLPLMAQTGVVGKVY